MAKPFFTIGHSTRPMDEFVDLLRHANVDLVIDVRSIPRSRTNPHYNYEAISEALSAYQIGYAYIAALGGRRTKARDVPETVNAFWEHQSFHNYADYATAVTFRSALAELREAGHARRCAIIVRGSGVVAMPPAHHCGLFARGRRGRLSHPCREPHRAGAYD